MNEETTNNETPNQRDEKLYPLDWKQTEVKLAKGRFTHTLQRPSTALMLEREDELEMEIPIAKDGSYSLPDTTEQEEIDAKYHGQICMAISGYGAEPPTAHRAAAFQGLFQREIYLDPECDPFGDEVVVIEEIGTGDEPDFVIRHVLRAAEESEVKKFRQKNNNGRLMPDKRGRQKFMQKSNLRSAMAFYQSLVRRMSGASVGGAAFSEDCRSEFIEAVNPLIQRKVVAVYVEALTGNLLD